MLIVWLNRIFRDAVRYFTASLIYSYRIFDNILCALPQFLSQRYALIYIHWYSINPMVRCNGKLVICFEVISKLLSRFHPPSYCEMRWVISPHNAYNPCTMRISILKWSTNRILLPWSWIIVLAEWHFLAYTALSVALNSQVANSSYRKGNLSRD